LAGTSNRRRIVNEGDAIDTAKLQRFVGLNTITLWAPFHHLSI
jgi:hypothetical protein